VLVAALIAVVPAVAGCASGDAGSSAGEGPNVDRGAQVYGEACASCHGADLRGTDKGPSHLSVVYEPNHHSDDSFRSAIANGAPQHHWSFGDMEPVEGLSKGDVDDVIAFIRAAQQRHGFEP
jgi:mono/diheme cytochrome c family protein